MSALDRQSKVQWFADLSQRLGTPQDPVFNLLTEVKIDEDRLRQMRDAVMRYICAPLGDQGDLTSEQAVLEAAGSKLANRTPNGLLMAKQEFQAEVNHLHKVMADWLHSLGIDDLIYQIFCPIMVRLVKGQRNLDEESRRSVSRLIVTWEDWYRELWEMEADTTRSDVDDVLSRKSQSS